MSHCNQERAKSLSERMVNVMREEYDIEKLNPRKSPYVEKFKMQITKDDFRKEYEVLELDIVAYNEAYAEYLDSGNQSTPIEALWKELDL